MKNLEYKNFEIKQVTFKENEELVIGGYASKFNEKDALNPSWHPELKKYVLAEDIMHSGAFTKTIAERKNRIATCKNHDINNPVGKLLEIKEDETGLWIESRISDSELELKTKIREEIYNELSIGYVVVKCTMEQKQDGTYVRHIYEVKLYEVSIVTIGRHGDTKITERKNLQDITALIDNIIDKEKNEEKKYQLLQLKSLITDEPDIPLAPVEPKKEKAIIDFDKITFIK